MLPELDGLLWLVIVAVGYLTDAALIYARVRVLAWRRGRPGRAGTPVDVSAETGAAWAGYHPDPQTGGGRRA